MTGPCRAVGLALLWPCFGFVLAADWNWEKGESHRSATLSVQVGGKVGFTLLQPLVTGINFSNRLSDTAAGTNRILENGSGVALGDIDGDGWCDIYFCGLEGSNVLYRNLGNCEFQDVTASSGVACEGQYSTGAVFAEVDGDGDLDLLVNCIGGGTRLFLNNGKGRFAEAKQSGLVRKLGATSMALADVDRDGDLDLYVTNYRTTNYKDRPPDVKPDIKLVNGKPVVTPADRFTAFVMSRGTAVTLVEKGEADILYLNDGQGHFSPMSWTDGTFTDENGVPLTEPPQEWGLSLMFRDINGDGMPDIYVCNDFFFSRDRVWLNDGHGRFRALPSLARRNMSMSSMTIDFADINRDGFDDFFVADMLSRSHTLRQTQRANLLKGELELPISDLTYTPEVFRNTMYLNRGDGTYAEIAQLSGVNASEWSWSAVFLDVDLDGYEDLLITTGNNHDVLDADTTREWAALTGAAANQPVLLRYPKLETPKLAFRNRGDLTFADASAAWGFDTVGIAQGMALADLDHDGDLDVVVNNLNGPVGIYRNDTSAPRLAVRLRGGKSNPQGIGAKVRIVGAAVPQSQEIICGGRYLSGDDPMRVFAASSPTNELRIEVRWPSGRESIVQKARANRIYEIEEPETSGTDAGPRTTDHGPRTMPLFEDVSHLLEHTHEDEPFDDFSRQPLLASRLSQLGPGVTWFDTDGDGWEDLIIGGGRGGKLTVFRNDQRGGFSKASETMFSQSLARDQTTILGWRSEGNGAILLAGSSNYEDGLTNGASLKIYSFKNGSVADGWHGQFSSVGPLAMADVDGDGDLDLFAGARVLPGRYPEVPASRLYRNDAGRFRLDVENSKRFLGAGMISGAVFSDPDGDGDSDLVLACDWGPVRFFRNEGSKFTEATSEFGLDQHWGKWNGVAVGDFNADGKMDLVASNWGRNTKYQNYIQEPLRLYYGDFNGDGRTECVEAYRDPGLRKVVPWASFDTMAAVLPAVQDRFATYKAYGSASVEEILGDRFKSTTEIMVTTLDSMVFLNHGNHFEAKPLPIEAQFAPAFGICVGDADGDGNEDIFLAHNFFDVEIETSRYDGGLGLWLRGDGQGGFRSVQAAESGVRVLGEQRGCALSDYDGDGRIDLVVAQNRAATKLYHNVAGKPGFRVRLIGPPNNPTGIGVMLRLESAGRWGPAREVHLGGGYWSQDGAIQVLSAPAVPTRLEARWPAAGPIVASVPPGAREITWYFQGQIRMVR